MKHIKWRVKWELIAIAYTALVMLVGCGGENAEVEPTNSNSSSSSSSSSSSGSSSGGSKADDILITGKALYESQCSACHGDTGKGTSLAPGIKQAWPTVTALVEKIDFTMPPGGADSKCDLTCSKKISAYILAGYSTTGTVHPDLVFQDSTPKVSTLKGLAALPESTQSKVYSARADQAIPMRIEAEHFDAGGQDVSFSDTTPGNVGTQPMVRDGTDVDFGIYDGAVTIGWFEPEEWVEFSFHLDTAATINIGWQVASARDGRLFTWSVNGLEQSTIAVPNTGDWGSFVNINSATPYLDKGWHTIRVASAGSFNLDYLQLSMADRQPVDTVDLDHSVPSKMFHRLTKYEYLQTVNELFSSDFSNIVSEFDNDSFGDGFDRNAPLLSVDERRFEKLLDAAGTISETAMANASVASKILSCSLSAATVNSCGRKIVKDWGLKLARRPLMTKEIDRQTTLLRTELERGATAKQAVQKWLHAMLASASFLHHVELEPSSKADTDTYTLSPYELANRLSYFIWCTMPDQTLFDLAESGELSKDSVLSQQIDRMLDNSKSSCLVDSITSQWLRLEKVKAATASIQPGDFEAWEPSLADEMINESKAFVFHLIKQNKPVSELLSANYSFMSTKLADFYNVNRPDSTGKVDLSATERKGFLTQGSFLAQTRAEHNTFIHRGIYVLEHFLCDPPPPPPANIDTSGSTEGVSECQGCHRYINPVGKGLNHFNEVGRFSDTDDMGNAISAEGAFFNGPAFTNANEMIDILVQDERVPACVMDQFLGYALAAEPHNLEHKTKESVVAAWERSGLGFRDMLKVIATSPSFKYRPVSSAE